nr:hypothetical protein [Tanacetum cinerariifolium]
MPLAPTRHPPPPSPLWQPPPLHPTLSPPHRHPLHHSRHPTALLLPPHLRPHPQPVTPPPITPPQPPPATTKATTGQPPATTTANAAVGKLFRRAFSANLKNTPRLPIYKIHHFTLHHAPSPPPAATTPQPTPPWPLSPLADAATFISMTTDTSTITTAATHLVVIVTTSLRRHHLHPTVTTTTQPPLSPPKGIIPGAFPQFLDFILSPMMVSQMVKTTNATQKQEYPATVVVSGVPGAETRVHTPGPGESEAQNRLLGSILSSGMYRGDGSGGDDDGSNGDGIGGGDGHADEAVYLARRSPAEGGNSEASGDGGGVGMARSLSNFASGGKDMAT